MVKELKKIMLVEDEEDIRTIAQIALSDIGGFTVKYCSSGPEALQNVDEFKPDLILLDMMMPSMDGLTVMQELRKRPTSDGIPVIFMTAKVQTSEVGHYLKLGALDVIAKPFDPMSLAETIRNIWKKSHG